MCRASVFQDQKTKLKKKSQPKKPQPKKTLKSKSTIWKKKAVKKKKQTKNQKTKTGKKVYRHNCLKMTMTVKSRKRQKVFSLRVIFTLKEEQEGYVWAKRSSRFMSLAKKNIF